MAICRAVTALVVGCLLCLAHPAIAGSKLLATSAGQQIEGQAGGGLVPWALLAGYGDVGEWGFSAAASRVTVDDFTLDVTGMAVSLNNRLELSIAQQRLDVQPLGLTIQQQVLGTKLRIGGDLIYGRLPVVTAGVQWKQNRDAQVPLALGARDNEGVDYTLSASRLWLNAVGGRNLIANFTLRHTKANQIGFLGFGGPTAGAGKTVAEASLGLFLTRHWVIGAEYRQKPNQLKAINEEPWTDLFLGWFPTKRFSVIGAYTDLGDIAGLADQKGFYFSLQLTH